MQKTHNIISGSNVKYYESSTRMAFFSNQPILGVSPS